MIVVRFALILAVVFVSGSDYLLNPLGHYRLSQMRISYER